MKKIFLSAIFMIYAFMFPLFSETNVSIFSDYEMGDAYYDRKDYDNAIKKYLDYWNKYILNIDELNKNCESAKDKNGVIKESYFSLYNTACCYSLLKEYENAEFYLIYSILAGYPYLDYLLKDSDLTNLFMEKKELKTEIQTLFKKGNVEDIFVDKRIFVDSFEGISFYFFKDKNGNYRFTKNADVYLDIAKKEIYGEGSFEFNNFTLLLKYDVYKETLQDYKNNLREEKKYKQHSEYIYWHTIGTDMNVSAYYLTDDWDDCYRKKGKLLILEG